MRNPTSNSAATVTRPSNLRSMPRASPPDQEPSRAPANPCRGGPWTGTRKPHSRKTGTVARVVLPRVERVGERHPWKSKQPIVSPEGGDRASFLSGIKSKQPERKSLRGTPQAARLRTQPAHQTSALVPRASARSGTQPSASETMSRRPICRRDVNAPPSPPKNPPQIDAVPKVGHRSCEITSRPFSAT